MMQTWKGGFLRLLREAFKVIDNDHDDYLRPKELRTIMASLGFVIFFFFFCYHLSVLKVLVGKKSPQPE